MSFGSVRSVLPLLCIVALLGLSSCHGCLTDQGKLVDWYVALRIPNTRSYMIWEPKTKSFRTTSELLLSKSISVLSDNGTKAMLWNDQTSTSTSGASKAHAKGILHFNPNKGGFLMIHSIPQFVDVSNNVFDPVTKESSSYGQSIACVSLTSEEEAKTAIDHVMSQNSNIYYNTFEGTTKPRPKNDRMVSAFPAGFTLVTKTSISEEHPFEDMLIGHFKTSWLVNTWGRPYKTSDCKSAMKISNVVFKQIDTTVTKNTQDHSKWAISQGGRQKLICIGDLNHMDSQASRGGSFLCRQDATLHKAMLSFVLQDECGLVEKKETRTQPSRAAKTK